MSNLLGGLINAARALGAHQAGIQTAGRNLANANNAAYARQRVILGDRTVVDTGLGPQGSGVEVLGLAQIRDRFLDANVTQEISHTSLLQAQQGALQRAETSLGEKVDRTSSSNAISDTSHSTNGISAALNDFFTGWEELSANPTDTGARQVLLQKANTLADKFNVADQRLAGLQTDLTTQVSTDTAKVNTLLQQIASLNGQIGATEAQAPGAAMDLRDQRQSQLEELAKYVDFSVRPLAGFNGQIEVVAKDTGGGSLSLVEGNNARAFSFTGTGFTGGQPPVALAVQGGSLAGNLAARDGTIATLRTDLRHAAEQLATAVNTAYNPGGASTDFFKVPPTSGIIAINPTLTSANLRATATGNSGANEIAIAVGNIAPHSFSTSGGDAIDGTVNGFFSRTVSGLGATLAGVNTQLTDQQSVQSLVTQQRNSVTGVSMDEEMADLMKYQRAYEASARVVRTIDDLLDTIIHGLSR